MTTTPKIKAYYGSGGALVTDRPVEGVTHKLSEEVALCYGGPHFIAESMNARTANIICGALGIDLVDKPFLESIRPDLSFYEVDLPDDMTNEEYDVWYAKSAVVDGIRMGPKFERREEEPADEPTS